MPLQIKPNINPKVYLPGYQSLSAGGYMQELARMQSSRSSYGQFEEGQLAKIQGGRADFDVNSLVSAAIKEPAYALETPLRPLNLATGGLVGAIAKGTSDVISATPVLSNVIGGIGDIIHLSDQGVGVAGNSQLAMILNATSGKGDSEYYDPGFFGAQMGPNINRPGGKWTVGDIREFAMERFGTDREGKNHTFEEIQKIANEHGILGFGDFKTSASGFEDFISHMAFNPLNLIFIPGVAGAVGRLGLKGFSAALDAARMGKATPEAQYLKSVISGMDETAIAAGNEYLTGLSQAPQWARPITSTAGTLRRYGYGYAEQMGRGFKNAYKEMHNPTGKAPIEFLDVNSAAAQVSTGGLRQHGYMQSLLKSMSWTMRAGAKTARSVYLPGLNTELKGGRLVGNALRSYMRGGIQQQIGESLAEGAIGSLDNYLVDNNLNQNVVGGTVSHLHDMLSKLNNDHPLSDNDGIVLAALFLPAFGAAGDIQAAVKGNYYKGRLPVYVNNVTEQVRLRLEKEGLSLKDHPALFERLGQGDAARGQAIMEWAIEHFEFRKISNQFSHLTNQTLNAELDGFLLRLADQGPLMAQKMLEGRARGALQPRSTADYMFEQHGQNFITPKGSAELASEVTTTGSSFLDELNTLYTVYEKYAGDMQSLGVEIGRGAPFTAEARDAMIAELRQGTGPLHSAEARQLLEMGPALMHNKEFWRKLSVSLGQKPWGGKRALAEEAAVSRQDVINVLSDMMEVPSAKELFFDTIQASLKVERPSSGVFQFKDTPFPMGRRLKESREEALLGTRRVAQNQREATKIRDTEFFRNGKPRISAAEEVTSPAGQRYTRNTDGSYSRPTDGVTVKVEGGVVRTELPANRIADLTRQQRPLVYRSGPRKGAIKPGNEAEHARLNLAIEDAQLGIDRDAIITATQNGGRVIVADVRAGSRLADLGYAESSRITSIKAHIEPTVVGGLSNTTKMQSLMPLDKDFVYHASPKSNLSNIQREGLKPRGKENAVFFGGDGIDVSGLIPRKNGNDVIIIRTSRKNVTRTEIYDNAKIEKLAGEYASNVKIESSNLEIMGENGQWYPASSFSESSRASYAFKGGNPTKMVENAQAGAFEPYRPTKRTAKAERGAVGTAKRDVRQSGVYQPAVDYHGPGKNVMFPDERRALLNEMSAEYKRVYKERLKTVSKYDEMSFELLPFDRRIEEYSGREMMDEASITETQKFTEIFRDMQENWPELSVKPRSAARMIVDPKATRFNMYVSTVSRFKQLYLDYGWFSPVARFYDAIFGGKNQSLLGKAAQTEVHNLMAESGWDPNATRDFIAQLRQEILDSRAVDSWQQFVGSHRYGTIQALPEGKVRAIAARISPEHHLAIMEKYGSYQKMITEASNRAMRTVNQAVRKGGSINPITRAAGEMMRTWQGSAFSSTTRTVVKDWYPFLRFYTDPLFMAMNWWEPYIYGLANNGTRNLRAPSAQGERLADLASAGLIPPEGLASKELGVEHMFGDFAYTIPPNIRRPMTRDFEIRTQKEAERIFEQVGREHPVAQMFMERFGDDVPVWAEEANRLLSNLVKQPDDFIRAEWNKVLTEELGYTHAELKQFLPMAERLSEVYRGVYSDMADLYVGRFSRSNLERFANNYFVMWPVSYMIKASKWMYNILFKKIGPVNGSAGAYAWDEYRQKYEKLLENDPGFEQWASDNEDFLFIAELMLPITPINVGLALNGMTRRVGGLVAPDIFGDYKDKTLPSIVGSGVNFGYQRAGRVINDTVGKWLSNAEVPGFYTEGQTPNTRPRNLGL